MKGFRWSPAALGGVWPWIAWVLCVSLSLTSWDWSNGFGLYEDMEIALDFRVKIASRTGFPDRQGKLCPDWKCYVKMILLALRIYDD
jgi:hypothetical protein